MMITAKETEQAKVKICDGDLVERAKIHLQHILKRDPTATSKNKVKYTFKVEVINCNRSNAAHELLEIFMKIGHAHLENISDRFLSKIGKLAKMIENIFKPNGTKSIVSHID